jgi:hypothetical protein
LFLIGLPMLLVALVTLLVSDSLFPDERDFRILGPLPIRRSTIFGAKLAALILFAGMVAISIHLALVPVMLLTSINRFSEHAAVLRLGAWGLASAGASVFGVLFVSAIVGVFMLAASRSRMHSLSAISKSLMLGLLVLSVPLVFHLPAFGTAMATNSKWLVLVPPAWFVGLERVLLGSPDVWFVQLAGIALAAFGTAAAIVAIVYMVLFKHFERLLLRPPAVTPRWYERHRAAASTRVSSFDDSRQRVRHGRWPPAFRAIYAFTTVTLGRSQLHQGVLAGLSACGAGFAINQFIGTDLAGRLESASAPSPLLVSAATWTPFALMFVCGLSVRAALALPMEHRANWIFRLTEDKATRVHQMRAVNRIVTIYVVGLPVAAAIPVLWLALGSPALIAAGVVALVGLVFVHVVLLDWRRIPFTCSYLPGKRLIAHTLVFGFAAFVLFTAGSVQLLNLATLRARYALVIAGILALVAWLLERRRLAAWRETPLIFDDEFPDQPLQLGL